MLNDLDEKKSITGNIHFLENFGTVDGPGVRFVVFMQGCIFRCLYCHNPHTFKIGKGDYNLTTEEVFEKMMKFKHFYTDGGLTVSGGEPLLQPQFVKELFKLCKAHDIHTALDTAGIKITEEVKDVLEVTDLVLLDIKCMDHEIHKNLTGQPLEPTLKFAEYLAKKRIPIWIRYVLVPGWTDDEKLVEKHADYASKLGNVEQVEILPFHKLGQHKYEKLDLKFPLEHIQLPTPEQIEKTKEIYSKKRLKVT